MYYIYLWNSGDPKGVILSHGGILNGEGGHELLKSVWTKKLDF